MVCFISQKCKKYLFSGRARNGFLVLFHGDEDGIDLGKNAGIFKGQDPAPVVSVFIMEYSQSLHRLASAEPLPPGIERNLLIDHSRTAEIVGVENQ